MKKNNIISMIIMAAACALLASCSLEKENKTQIGDGGAITFETSIATKSVESTLDLVRSQDFMVAATHTVVRDNVTTVANVFDSHPCRVMWTPNDPEVYTYQGDLKYWDAAGTYDFTAYAGYLGMDITTTDRMSTVAGQYLINQTDNDLLLAYAHVDRSQPSDNNYPKVHLNFRHALAAIEFKIYADAGTDADLTGFYVSNVVTGGTFSIGAGPTPAAKSAINWSVADPQPGQFYKMSGPSFTVPKGSENAVDVYGPGNRKIQNQAATFSGNFATAIPQTLQNQSVVFTIVSGGETVTTTKKLTSPTGKWEQGHRYIYTIKVEGAHIDLILVTTTEWDNVIGVAGDDVILKP